MPLTSLILVLAAAATQAEATPGDPLAALRASLARLPATTPVRATVEHRVSYTTREESPGPPGKVEALAAAGPDGLQMTWSLATLAEAEREEARRIGAADAPTPTRDGLADLSPIEVAWALDAAADLLRSLVGAELLAARDEAGEGGAVRVLVLKVSPMLGARERRYVKEVTATATLYLGADGLPLSAEMVARAHGRAFLVIGFDVEQREAYRFARSGDRLVTTFHEVTFRSSGAGERSARRAVTALALAP